MLDGSPKVTDSFGGSFGQIHNGSITQWLPKGVLRTIAPQRGPLDGVTCLDSVCYVLDDVC